MVLVVPQDLARGDRGVERRLEAVLLPHRAVLPQGRPSGGGEGEIGWGLGMVGVVMGEIGGGGGGGVIITWRS